jgi:dihydrofolate synthase / folylpolyglutamate synthase
MRYHETVQYLYNLQQYGIKFGLENINKLLSALDNPHNTFSAIHIAGTNGKGSTSALIASIMRNAGLRVGLFTSPHIISFTERIRINGDEIAEHDVIQFAEEIREIISRSDGLSPTFFEVVTAMALLYFKRNNVDIAVLEVGMGGRLDATNIITPEVAAITNIGLDHKAFLGQTLGEIACEKVGIIKKNVPVVSSFQDPEAKIVIEKRAEEEGAGLFLYGRDFSAVLKHEDISGICFDYSDGNLRIHDLTLPLAGVHQMQNASIAIKAATIALRKNMMTRRHGETENEGTSISLRQESNIIEWIRDGFASAKWPGRLEFISENPPIVIDGAHNPAAAAALSHALKRTFLEKYKKIIMILGIMNDKDAEGIMEPLLPLTSDIIVTAPAGIRAATPEKLAAAAASLGFHSVQITRSVKEAIDRAAHIAMSHAPCPLPLIVVTGSFYTIGEAKEVLGQKGVLGGLRE